MSLITIKPNLYSSIMSSRRKFLLQSSMATTALLAVKPFNSIASIASPLTGTDFSNNKFLLLHTSNNGTSTLNRISTLSKKYSNVLLIHSGTAAGNTAQLKFDVTKAPLTGYQVLYKGDIKIGIIHTDTSVTNVISDINTRAAYLKQEKNCNFVVCISSLEEKSRVNDRRLAERSSGIDLIVGKYSTNHWGQPLIVLNEQNQEVIVDHADGKEVQLGSIVVSFCNKGLKSELAF